MVGWSITVEFDDNDKIVSVRSLAFRSNILVNRFSHAQRVDMQFRNLFLFAACEVGRVGFSL